mmetsp:Transcript_56569/g.121448  ORF Transcript_56569/g.121448 Transcript_56569/m.121448 type:complete len:135 (+) Transcript_56569:3-407(+)
MVGLFMTAPVGEIDWDNLAEAVPAYFTISVMTFTYSISNGVVAGLGAHLVLTLCLKILPPKAAVAASPTTGPLSINDYATPIMRVPTLRSAARTMEDEDTGRRGSFSVQSPGLGPANGPALEGFPGEARKPLLR